jgi:hypothetical protein
MLVEEVRDLSSGHRSQPKYDEKLGTIVLLAMAR